MGTANGRPGTLNDDGVFHGNSLKCSVFSFQ
jgi:hypothetical protein